MSSDKDLINRLRDAVKGESGLGRLHDWCVKNTRHKGKPYSTKGYEYQEDILNDPSFDLVGIKPRQVGFSEVILRMTLGLLATTANINAILLLPHAKKALSIVKSRYDPVIRNSPVLKDLMVPGSDSSGFKQIGTSQFFAAGTWSGDIISDPIDIRITDELDYCRQETLVTSESSMDASIFVDPRTQQRGIRRTFSTPILPNTGVHALYNDSSQARRTIIPACDRNHEFAPDFLEHVVLPKYDRPMIDLIGDPAALASLELSEATLLCPTCHAPVPQTRLTPEYRRWVHAFPDHPRHGYHVSPFDLPFDPQGRPARTPEWILRQRIAYGSRLGKFYNHVLGLPYADETNSINVHALATHATPLLTPPLFAGIDVGKMSWLVVGHQPRPSSPLDIVALHQIRLSHEGDDLPEQIASLLALYKPVLTVIDAYPYTPSVLKLQSLFPHFQVLAADYFLKDTSLHSYQIHHPTQRISLHRTRCITAMAQKVNKGQIRFPPDKDNALITHLSNIKKIDTDPDNENDDAQMWVNTGPDHYAHALTYLNIAATLFYEDYTSHWTPTPSIRVLHTS